ncbi:DUF4132 domain-containing protein [Clostridium aciditolerans]|uniref:DUF4132 domain-containing protein n=1 Tax=Clostridium aciditolerans TaxID=339861 RepID=A0A934I2F9_9CLOT|nr:DUF4132 domain-containing protein [Clostridium aciditolerans]MBI6874795.1 DUF4132 domain-containing protein [Clostridium aciditolerans]
MGLQQHLIEKISDVLLELGLSNEVIDSFEAYIEGTLEEQEFFKSIPNIDMDNLNADVVEQMVSAYKSLDKHKAYDYLSKYIKILFQMGKVSVFSIIDKTAYYYGDEYCRKFLKYNISPSFVIAYYAKFITRQERTLERGFIKFYDSLYEEYKDAFKEAFDISKINEQAIIATYLIQKEKDKELCSWLEEDMINSIGALFNDKIHSQETDILAKYLKGETSDLEETIELLKSNNNLASNTNTYILKFLIGISSTISNESHMANRFIKFAVIFDYKKSFNGLYDYLKYNRYNKITKLIEKLEIKKELYIAWMGDRNIRYDGYSFEKELKEELNKNKEEFIKATAMCSDINKVYMASLLWQKGVGLEFVNEGEDIFIHLFSIAMDQLNIERDIYENFIEYLKGNISFDNISETLQGLLGKKEAYLYGFKRNFIKVMFWLKDVSTMFEKAMKIFITIGNPDILKYIYYGYREFKGIKNGDEDLNSFIELLDSYGASTSNYISFLGGNASYYGGSSDQAKNIIAKLIEKDEEQVINNIPYCQVETRTSLLELLFKHCDESMGAKVLIEYLGDSSKTVREKVIELLTLNEKSHETVMLSLSAKKQAVREAVVRILSKSSNEKVIEALNKALEVEKTEKIKALLREALNVESDLEENNEELDILEYCKKALKGNKAAGLKWLDCDTLPKVRFKDSEKIAEDEIIKYMLICYSSCIEIGLSSEAKVVSELLDTKDLAKLALEVFERWLNSGAESKKKWVLPFAAVYGDYDVISVLKKNIEEWAKNSRGAIASEAVKALALNGSNEALIIVDNIARKFKFKQVKNAAATALQFASEQMGIDMEELSDRIVPDLGFDIKGERVFDYVDRKFIVTLTPELTLDVQDESGKKFKNLPAPNKKDDETKAAEASLEFKNLKKQLKTVANIQTIRLELALSSNRKWTKEAWVKLFVENPIMHQFSIGLVWGVYEDNILTDSFRYMEDGSFNTKDEDEYELKDGVVIGIVHPIELSKEDMELWKEQFENYEIKQPLEQLNREIFTVTEEEKTNKKVDRFGGTMLNGLSLLGKLTSFGWSRGPIGDGGGYYTFYKEDNTFKIDVELSFSGVSVGYENEEVTVYDLGFYKEGTASKYSYINDKIYEQNVVSPETLPKRFFSEILYQINKATASKTGTNENWKEEK